MYIIPLHVLRACINVYILHIQVSPLIWLGSKRQLQPEDMWAVPRDMEARRQYQVCKEATRTCSERPVHAGGTVNTSLLHSSFS